MLKRIFGKIENIKDNLEEVNALYEELKSKQEEITSLKNKNDDKYKTLISSYTRKSNALDILINSKNTKKLVVSDDFLDETNVSNNTGFEFLSDKTSYKLKPVSVTNIENLKIYTNYTSTGSSHTFLFNETSNTNKIECSFNDAVFGYINPTSIKYIKNGIEYELRENFERYFDRKESLINTYYFYVKEVDGIKFYFNSPSKNISINNVSFSLEEFEEKNEIIFKYPNTSTALTLLVKLSYDDMFSCLNFFYLKNNSFVELPVKNKMAYIDNDNNDIVIKAVFDKSKLTAAVSKSLVKEKIETITIENTDENFIDLCGPLEEVNGDINFKFSANYSLMKDVNSYIDKAISIVNEEPIISDNHILYLKSGEGISDSYLSRLNDLDNFEHLEFYKKELIVYDSDLKRVYFAKFMGTDGYRFRVTFGKKIMQEVSVANTYSPFIFDISVSE